MNGEFEKKSWLEMRARKAIKIGIPLAQLPRNKV